MSSSYNGIDPAASAPVQAFVYHNTGAPGEVIDSPAESEQASPRKAEELPRISEEEISRLVAEAHSKGMAEGVRQAEASFAAAITKERERTSQAILTFQNQCKDYYTRVELELVHLSLAIAAKILHRESQIDRMVVAGLVKVMLEKLHQNTKVIVRVRPEEEKDWQQYFGDHKALQVVGDTTLQPQDCVLETELGIANMGLDTQLKEVEQGFFDLLAQRPEAK